MAAQRPSTRLPAPSLFVGPPSRNASNTSLLPPAPQSSGRPAPGPQRALRSERPRSRDAELSPRLSESSAGGNISTGLSPLRKLPLTQQSNSRTDALWAEMQNTLEEVELSATSGGRVFGTKHAAALDALRVAQIQLAQAWAKSEADEEDEHLEGRRDRNDGGGTLGTTNILATDSTGELKEVGTGAGSASGLSGTRQRRGTSVSMTSEKIALEEDTENDIMLARRRREANDRYFGRVNRGVEEVVRKLEDVASAMKGVEVESKEIWNGVESADLR